MPNMMLKSWGEMRMSFSKCCPYWVGVAVLVGVGTGVNTTGG